jgi:hypothetical protein
MLLLFLGAPLRFFVTRLLIVLGMMVAAGAASSHPAPFSYLDVYLEADAIHGVLVIHDFDAARELQIATPAALLEPSVVEAHRDSLQRLLGSRLKLLTDGELSSFEWQRIEVMAGRQSLRLAFKLDRLVSGRLDINASLFPYDVNHQTFINIYEGGALKRQAILDTEHRVLRFYRGTAQGWLSIVTTFAKAGVHHILIGPDHVLFLLGLMLLGGSWLRLATIVTAFTVGHSITLSLAALGIVQIAPSIVEPAIALSIIVVGVDNLLVDRQRRAVTLQTAPRAHDLRPWMAATFGLIHGFGFAAVLIQFGLPQEALGWSLAAFNIGVEVGQLVIVLIMIVLGRLVMRLPRYREWMGQHGVAFASIAVIAAGTYWLMQRIVA